MDHKLKRPCAKCPFRTDVEPYLRAERVAEISEGLLRGQSFPCHETVNYDEEEHDEDGGTGQTLDSSGQAQCAGAEIMLAHHGTSTQMSRIAESLGLPVAELDMDSPVYKSTILFVRAQSDYESVEPCGVTGPNCEAPAG